MNRGLACPLIVCVLHGLGIGKAMTTAPGNENSADVHPLVGTLSVVERRNATPAPGLLALHRMA
jgi:hypothetical protein